MTMWSPLLLLLTDVDIHAVDTHGKTALMLSEEAGHSHTVDLLQIAAEGYDLRNSPIVLTELMNIAVPYGCQRSRPDGIETPDR